MVFEAGGLLAPEQAGFRQGMNSTDQFNVFVQEVADGFQRLESTYAVFLDLQQAYDRVWWPGLYLKLRAMGVLGRTYRWIQEFLSGRQNYMHTAAELHFWGKSPGARTTPRLRPFMHPFRGQH